MYSIDKSNFKNFIKKFPRQISEANNLYSKGKIKISYESVGNIVYLGMGGSAITGDMLHDILFDRLQKPVNVVRGYECPSYCCKSTLVLVSSYSGNTEETLASAQTASGKGAQILAICSGGDLLKMAKKNKWSYIQIPQGLPPRQALGYLFFPLLYVLNPLLEEEISDSEINDAANLVVSINHRNDEQTAKGKSFAKELALEIHGKIPVIYSASPYFKAVATRWRNQFQENSKSIAFSNTIPEMNHNEIVGWEMRHDALNHFIVIFLEDQSSSPRIQSRIALTKNIIRERQIETLEVYAEGKSLLEKLVSLISISDWTSYYLALYNEKNPASILNIDYLKAELKKLA